MSSANSVILKLSEAYPAFRKVFLYYNLYVRNLKLFFKNSQSQFGEDKKIVKLFGKDKIVKILKKNNYTLKFKSFVNYVFIKK